jgi:hypothetical protein
MPAFSLRQILDVAQLRLRVQHRCGLGLNQNLPLLDDQSAGMSVEGVDAVG